MNKKEYSISENYTQYPGPRYISQGKLSGEHFRTTILEALFQECIDSNLILEVNLDYTYGYGTSFIEETFGGLARKFGKEKVKKHIKIISEEEPHWKEFIWNHVEKN